MSNAENAELVRKALVGFGREDISLYWAEDCLVIAPDEWPEAEELTSRAAWKRQIARLEDPWEETHIDVDDLEPLDEGRVLVAFRYVATGAGSGIPLEMPMGAIYTVRDGMIVHTHFYNSPEAARAAAGLDG